MDDSLGSVRIRLEGRLETIERATEGYTRALAAMRSTVPLDLTPVRAELEALAAAEPAVDEAVQALVRLVRAEGWGARSPASRVLSAHGRAWKTLHDRLGKALAAAGMAADARLAPVIRDALDFFRPAGESLYSCKVRGPAPKWILPASVVSLASVVGLMTTDFPTGVAALAAAGLVGASALVASATQYELELFADRLRLSNHARAFEVRLDPRNFDRASPTRLRVRSIGWVVTAISEETEYLLTMMKLLTTVDWKVTAPPPADELLLPARWTATRAPGALIVCEGEAYFLHGGRRAWDVVARIPKDWSLPMATLLGWALLRLPREERHGIFLRLEEAECLERLGPAPEFHFEPLRARIAGVVDVPMDRKMLSQIFEWEARVARLRVERVA